jgi:hypothetical protein
MTLGVTRRSKAARADDARLFQDSRPDPIAPRKWDLLPFGLDAALEQGFAAGGQEFFYGVAQRGAGQAGIVGAQE